MLYYFDWRKDRDSGFLHLKNILEESPINSTKMNISLNIQIKASELKRIDGYGFGHFNIEKSVERSMHVCNLSLNR